MASALALSCAHNVPQDLATGDDGKFKTARPIVLDDNAAAKVHGIVTYPGGDRIDWRKLELPKDKTGVLSVVFSWTPPRPGLALGIDVFDQYGHPVASKQGKHGSNKTRSQTEIKDASGTYLVRVYAPERGDAGAYTLKLAFAAAKGELPPGFPPPATAIPDPPRLPAVPPPPAGAVVCDDTNFRTTKGCEKYCPTIPDVAIPACWKTMPCPAQATTKVRDCAGKVPLCADGAPVTEYCVPQGPPPPEKGTIANIAQKTGEVDVTFTVKRGHKSDKGWKGYLVDKAGKRVANSDFTVYKVAEREVWGKIKLTSDQVDGKTAVISPP